jgi:hypothetical protein
LSQDDDAHAVVRGAVEGVEDEFAWRIDGDVCVFGVSQDLFDAGKVGFGKFVVEGGFPTGFDLDVVRVYCDFRAHVFLVEW